MKITILGPAHPYRGGIASFDERLAHQLISEGHDVEMCTFKLQYPSFLFPGKTQYSTEPDPKDLRISRRMNSCNPFNWINVGREIAKQAPDLLIIAFWLPMMAPCLGTIARFVRRNNKTKVVAILHNLIPHETRVGDKPFARYFCHSVDAFVALSKSVLNDINIFETKKPRVFSPHPIYDHYGDPLPKSEACAKLNIDDKTNYLLFFGLIREYKGLDWMLEAFAKTKVRKNRHTKLIVAGEFYGNGDKYLAQAKELGIEDDIIWHSEFVADSDIKYYFSVADVIVQPYKSATQSGVTQVAYHFEKPMIVTNVGGLTEIVPNGKVGYAVNPNAISIADAIDDFYLTDSDFTQGIRDEKQKYSWTALCSKTIELCQKK